MMLFIAIVIDDCLFVAIVIDDCLFVVMVVYVVLLYSYNEFV